MCLIQYLGDISRLDLLNEMSKETVEKLIVVSTLGLNTAEVYPKLVG